MKSLVYAILFLFVFLVLCLLPAFYVYIFKFFGIEVRYTTMFIINLVSFAFAQGFFLEEDEDESEE